MNPLKYTAWESFITVQLGDCLWPTFSHEKITHESGEHSHTIEKEKE